MASHMNHGIDTDWKTCCHNKHASALVKMSGENTLTGTSAENVFYLQKVLLDIS